MTAEPPRHRVFDEARRRAELSVQQLWLSFLALGGRGDLFDVEAFLTGLATLADRDQDVLAHAINEELLDIYEAARVPYLIDPQPQLSPTKQRVLDVLAELLERPDPPNPPNPSNQPDRPDRPDRP